MKKGHLFMIKRHLEAKLIQAANSYRVLSVTGPRQSGKTTLVRQVFKDARYVSLENPQEQEFALTDPRGFLAQFTDRVILDEVQRAPKLFSYIQGIVDERQKKGQFILTGSQNFLLMEKVSQSLAGRCAVLHLLPFSRGELANRPMMDIESLGKTTPQQAKKTDRSDLFEQMFKGFYPPIYDQKLTPQDWLANYYRTYVERDVRQVLNLGDSETFARFVRLCAGRSGQLLNMSSLAADSGISVPTVKRWLSLLQASFLIYLLQPYHSNFNKRLVKSPKLYFYDTGLLCYLLRIRSGEELITHSARGAVFETFVISELLKNCSNDGREPDIFFWRDSAGHEIDVIIDLGSKQIPIEIKSGQTLVGEFFAGLEYWRSLPGQDRCKPILVYGGQESCVRQKTVVISWSDWL
jgi:predicted AAA+ superfamily ATPase